MRVLKQIITLTLTVALALTLAQPLNTVVAEASEKQYEGINNDFKITRLTREQNERISKKITIQEKSYKTRKGASAVTPTIEQYRWYGNTKYFYDQLSTNNKKIYDAMDKACYDFLTGQKNGIENDAVSPYCLVPTKISVRASKDILQEIFYIFKVSNPQYYFLNSGIVFYGYNDLDIRKVYLLSYSAFKNGATRKKTTSRFITRINYLTHKIYPICKNYNATKIAKYVHHFLIKTVLMILKLKTKWIPRLVIAVAML